MPNPLDLFGQIDIYLFDQLQRRRIVPGMRVLDAGCGDGRNLVYFLRHGFDVAAVDRLPAAVDAVRALAAALAPSLPAASFRVEPVESIGFPDADFDLVICSAVLHFASDRRQFDAMLHSLWRVLKPQGLLFTRLASSIGLEDAVAATSGGRYILPDGSERYLVDESMLMGATALLGGEMLDPLKTTIVQGQRAMTTWVLRKGTR